MSLALFGLKQRPFAIGPDPASYYAANGHEEVLDEITTALDEGESIVLIAGEPGVGKTLLAHMALARLGDQMVAAFVTNSHLERPVDLLQAILFDFGLPHTGRTTQELRLSLAEFVLSQHNDGRRAVVVIDEAHLLNAEVLEEVRLFGNWESPKGKALQVILVAQPRIFAAIERPELVGLAQRLLVRVCVSPFGVRESIEYVGKQIERAGGKPTLFTEEAVAVLAQGTRGNPRLINQAGRAALAITAKAEASIVDVEGVMEALAQMPMAAPIEPEPTAPNVYTDESAAEMEPTVHDDRWQAGPYVGQPSRFEFSPTR